MKPAKKHSEVATVTALSLHLDCSREQIQRLEKQGVIERLPTGNFDLDASRVRVLRHLRERKSPGEFRNRYEAAKAIREERKVALEGRELCLMSDFATTQETMTALVFAAMDAAATRLHPHDRAERRRVEQEFTIAKECVSVAFRRLADDLSADPVSLMPSGPDIAAIRARLFGGGRPADGAAP
jgi:hypothetical protein